MVIVLVVHGMPPKDFSEKEKMEFLRLHSQHSKPGILTPEQIVRHDALEQQMRAWPRNAENDGFHAASYRIADDLREKSGHPVWVAFNEFCAPGVPEILDQAAGMNQGEVVVVTPMLTRGGSHAEFEIPREIDAARLRHPAAHFTYAWPFDSAHIAAFLNEQIRTICK